MMAFRSGARRAGAAFALLLGLAAFAGADDRAALVQRHESQQQAREQARGLVSRVLDVQLQNLEENKLQGLAVYRDIKAMRSNVNALIAGEMQEVIDLLARAGDASENERESRVARARQLVREIVARLAAERQHLRRRLKSAELSAQAQRLIEAQSRTRTATETLPEQPASRRDKSALAAIEDQRDVRQLYGQLAAALRDVARWGGDTGAGAADAVRSLEADAVDAELERVATALEKLQFFEAARGQQQIVDALHRVLDRIERSSGDTNRGRGADLATVRRLAERQAALRDATRLADLTGPDADPLIQSQGEIRKELDRLAQRLASASHVRESLDLARATASDATRRLFDAQRDQALDRQGKVVEQLGEIAEHLSGNGEAGGDDRSAQELAGIVRDLEQARQEMERIQEAQARVHREAGDRPESAGNSEERIAAELDALDDDRRLPRSVTARLSGAHEAAKSAAGALRESEGRKNDQAARRAVANADAAIERAASEIEAALSDAVRRAEAVRIGELARGAEALDRAAGAEREIAETARQAAGAQGLSAEAAREMNGSQEQIGKIAEKIAAAFGDQTPAAARELESARNASDATQRDLAEAEQEPGPPSRQAAARAAERAAAATQNLAAAARRLREEVAVGAGQLAEESARQSARAGKVREAVEQALDAAEPSVTAGKSSAGSQKALPSMQTAEQSLSTKQIEQVAAQAGRLARQAFPVDPGALAALREAEVAASETAADSSARDAAQVRARNEMQRAADSLSAREQRIRRDQAAAQAIADSASGQQEAADEIDESRQKLNSDSEDSDPKEPEGAARSAKESGSKTGAAPSGATKTAARRMNQAQEKFAQAQRAAGQGAEEIAGQSEIANPSLREALDLASRLSQQHSKAGDAPHADGAASDHAAAEGEAPKRASDLPTGTGQPKGGKGQGGEPHAGTDSAIGTGLVPNSPEFTAQMIAGRKAQSRAAAAGMPGTNPGFRPGPGKASSTGEEAGDEEPADDAAGEPAPGEEPGGKQGGSESSGAGGNPSGTATGNAGSSIGAGVAAGSTDAVPVGKSSREEPWLVRLPPELRKAIRARALRPPPRRYEERLQRYFESID